MKMKLADWNKSLIYAHEITEPYTHIVINKYDMYDGRKGIKLNVYDECNNLYHVEYSGTYNTFEQMKVALDNRLKYILEEV